MKAIFVLAVALASLANAREIETEGRRDQVCTPGDTKSMDCNTCFCSEDGSTWGCTLMLCQPELPVKSRDSPLFRMGREIRGQASPNEQNPQICEPGSTTKQDCNTCSCSQDGTAWACTRKMCPNIPAEYLNPDGSIKRPYQGNPLFRI